MHVARTMSTRRSGLDSLVFERCHYGAGTPDQLNFHWDGNVSTRRGNFYFAEIARYRHVSSTEMETQIWSRQHRVGTLPAHRGDSKCIGRHCTGTVPARRGYSNPCMIALYWNDGGRRWKICFRCTGTTPSRWRHAVAFLISLAQHCADTMAACCGYFNFAVPTPHLHAVGTR